MIFIAGLLVALGVGASLAAFWHDLQRRRIAREFPQAAPSRIAPEVHAVGALIAAGGVALWGGVGPGGLWLGGHLLVTYGIIRPVFSRWL